MQIAETLLTLFVVANIFYFIFGKKASRPMAYVGLGLLLIHIVLGEVRWQMAPAYLLLTILMAIHFFGISTRKWLRITGSLFGLLLVVLSTALCYALPVFSLYEPTGAFAIGSETLYLKDESRAEDITENPDDFRELMIDVWYPTMEPSDKIRPYLEPVERKGFAAKYGLPASAFSYLDGIKTHIYHQAPAAEGSFPVLIFSPGYYTPTSGYHSVLADLVSHGFIIFSINHSYETMGSRFPDGREIYFDQAYANAYSWSDAMANAVDGFDKAATEEEKYQAVKALNAANQGSLLSVARWSADIRAVVDAIEKWNKNPNFQLAGKMKLDQLGAFGHSRGGAAAIETSIFDDRIKAVANLDGAQWGHVMDTTLTTPTALFSSATTLLYDVNKYIFKEAKGSEFYDMVLANSGHSSFSDIPYMIRIPQLNEAGSIAPKAATQSVNGFLLVFFQKYLEGKSTNLTDLVATDEHLGFKE